MVTVNKGAVKFNSIKAAYEAAKRRNPQLKYITFYMRYRMGNSVQAASVKPVRKYTKRIDIQAAA